ncbi:MAG: hypothetical protein F6K54_19085 [Okeania sp. SIO3B5]|uniref:hypothetical protein n=1 Tax=Okeania sp. SIO3B5 TaxID=2607811 RepID=UPI001400EE9C|nr:hypothetical protein [Okeania sp. SIO3B5]NEO54994.1 hypothetical protein [Okeania sp. SIO3B5]
MVRYAPLCSAFHVAQQNAPYWTLAQLPKPLNLWVVNFAAPFQPETQNCIFNPESKSRISGYYFRMYQCQ